MSWGWAGGSRGLEHGSFPLSVCSILSSKAVGRCCCRSVEDRPLAAPGKEMSSGVGLVSSPGQQLCRSWCGLEAPAGSEQPPGLGSPETETQELDRRGRSGTL